MTSLFGALLSSLGFGSANVVIKKSLGNLTIPQTLFPATLSGVFFLSLLVLTTNIENFDINIIILCSLLALMEVSLYLVLYKTLSTANVSVAIALIGIYPVISLIFSILFLNEIIEPNKIGFIFLIVFGAIATSIKWEDVWKDGFDKGDMTKGLGWIIATTLVHALYFPLLGEFTSDGSWEYRLLVIKIFASLYLFLLFKIIKKQEIVPNLKKHSAVLLLGLLEVIGWVGFSWATSIKSGIPQSIIIAILTSSALVTAVGAYILLKEKLSKFQYLGILLIVISLIGLT